MTITLQSIQGIEIDWGMPLTLQRIQGGYSNDNYLLVTSLGKYRIRIPKYLVNIERLQAEKQLLEWCSKYSSLPIPLLAIESVGEQLTSIFPYIEAHTGFYGWSQKLGYSAGKALAEYHLAVKAYKGEYPGVSVEESLADKRYDIQKLLECVQGEFGEKDHQLYNAIQGLGKAIDESLEWIRSEQFKSLPFASCHGDYAPNNLLTVGDEVVGIIDFECARWTPRVYDVAIGMLAIQQSGENTGKIITYFLEGYQSKIQLTQQELALIPELQKLRTIESANRHFKRVLEGMHKMDIGLVLYWSRCILCGL